MAIPGPTPSSAGDNLDDITAAGGLHTFQLALHREYGDVAEFRLPGSRLVSVADPVLLEQVARVNKRPEKLFEFLAPLFETGNLQVMPAEEHTPWRRLVLSALAGRRMHEAHFGAFTRLAVGMADRWAAASGPVALQQELSELSLRMVCQYALGIDMDSGERAQRVVRAFEEVLTGEDGAGEALAYLRSTVGWVLSERNPSGRSDLGSSERSDLITLMAEAGEAPARVRDTVLVMLLAAHHTTGVAISWTLHLLAAHPEITERLREELAQMLGKRDVPEFGDLGGLKLLEMTLKESMRRYPPGPYGARETTEPLELGGHAIPAGTAVFIPIWAIHLNPQVWPDPERFDPGRFTPEQIAARPRLAYLPFGFGPRSCEGASPAMLEAQLVLAILLKRFVFTPVEGHPVVPVERFVLWAEHDIKMTVTRST